MDHSSIFASQLSSPILSEDYSDIIVRRQFLPSSTDVPYTQQIVNEQYSILYAPLSDQLASVQTVGYAGVPKLFTFINTVSLEASGITTLQTQPFLNLKGNGVLVGFLDSGIDYRHAAFRNPDGTTRILGIWDQTDQTGTPPPGLSYGSAYSEADINAALFGNTEASRIPVPETSETQNAIAENQIASAIEELNPGGHGTAVAGIACGSADPESNFTGAAPESHLLVVRLKPAKQYLRDYFQIPEGAQAFQENDLMLGIRYLLDSARQLQMPLVICCSLGSNQGGHTGTTPLEEVLVSAQFLSGIYPIAGTGNEAGMAHHFYGKLDRLNDSTDVELFVSEGTRGFVAEFWAEPSDLFDVGFISPLGETVLPSYSGPMSFQTFEFLREATKISVYYSTLEMQSGQLLLFIRFENPSPGMWRLRVTNRSYVNGSFHMWLPITGLIPPETRFASPNPDTTLVIPSCPEPVITVGAYNAYNGSLFLRSGRGYTRNGILKPNFASPGVDVTCPRPGGSYGALTGSSAACALASGGAALLAQWGLQRFQTRYLLQRELRNLFLRGVDQNSIYHYPNREWGYGTMNLYQIFERL